MMREAGKCSRTFPALKPPPVSSRSLSLPSFRSTCSNGGKRLSGSHSPSHRSQRLPLPPPPRTCNSGSQGSVPRSSSPCCTASLESSMSSVMHGVSRSRGRGGSRMGPGRRRRGIRVGLVVGSSSVEAARVWASVVAQQGSTSVSEGTQAVKAARQSVLTRREVLTSWGDNRSPIRSTMPVSSTHSIVDGGEGRQSMQIALCACVQLLNWYLPSWVLHTLTVHTNCPAESLLLRD